MPGRPYPGMTASSIAIPERCAQKNRSASPSSPSYPSGPIRNGWLLDPPDSTVYVPGSRSPEKSATPPDTRPANTVRPPDRTTNGPSPSTLAPFGPSTR